MKINERFRKSDLVLTQSKDDFMMDLKIRNEISRGNSFTFSNISSLNGSQSPADQQFNKLLGCVQCQKNNTVRKELESILPPLLCHLFIEMLKGKDWRPAHEFLRKYSPLVGAIQEIPTQKSNGTDTNLMPHQISFLPNQNASNLPQQLPSSSRNQPNQLVQLNIDEQKLTVFRDLIVNLSSVRRLEELKDNKLITSFRSNKYRTQMATKSLEILNNYLSKHGHVLIIQILHVWFSMELYELDQELNDDNSASSPDCAISKKFEYPNDARKVHRIVCYSDKAQSDKDAKMKTINRFHQSGEAEKHNEEAAAGGETVENKNLKRLQDCLQRVENKYHKPIRIFNINYSENR